ncbi:fibroblast growth factor receptor substrate 3-like isoform X1 [Arapaima gigas]
MKALCCLTFCLLLCTGVCRPARAMGSCWSCLYRDSGPDNHPTKFKVTNVDDEGNELGSGTMELTQTELVLHTRKRDAVRWPYLCLRRYGYDSNLFSFESGRRCQTGQGEPRTRSSPEELMQCNSINVVEEPVMMGRSGHGPELDIPRTPQTPNTPAYTVQGFPNGYPGYPISADSSHTSSRHPSLADEQGHSLMGIDDQTHTYVNTAGAEAEVRGRHCIHSLPEVRPSTFPDAARSLPPMGNQGGGHPSMHCCPHEEHGDPQVFLQTASQEVKYMLGPTPAQRRLLDRDRHAHHPHGLRGHEEGGVASEMEGGGPQSLPPFHMHNPHSYHHHHHHHHHHLAHRHPGPEHQEGCQATQLTYENINGLRGSARRGGRRLNLCPGSVSHSGGSSSSSSGGEGHPLTLSHGHARGPASLPSQGYGCERAAGAAHRKTARLNYENLPSLPPVWEYRALQRDEDDDEGGQDEEDDYEEEDFDDYELSEGPGTPNGYHQDGGTHQSHGTRDYVNTECMALGPPRRVHCSAGADYGYEFRQGGGGARGGCEHSHAPPSRQLNYIQVELDGEPGREPVVGGGAPQPAQHQLPPAGARRSEFYAVIDLKKTAAMSNLQRALPRDDGTARKTRHNSTDLPL